MKRLVRYSMLWMLLSLFATSCSDEVRQGLQPVPNAFGKVNQLVIVMDQELWESRVGDTLRYYYSAAYPILPQPEPIFDLRHFKPIDLEADQLRKELRNYFIIADLADPNSSTAGFVRKDLGDENIRRAKEDPTYNSSVGREKWARGQLLVYQFGYSEDVLIDNLKKNFAAITKRFREADSEKIDATVYFNGENKGLMEELKTETGIQMRIPSDYFLAINDGDVVWMRKETQELSSNLIIHKLKYTDKTQFTKENIKAIRDTIGKKYITSSLPDTYMRINDIDLPMFTSVKNVNNNYAMEARGIWEIVNDYMGGSFVSYLIHHPEGDELLFVDGFVHAPGKEKRDFMQHLEHIIGTVNFVN